jgi:peroxiredoxin
MLFRKIKNGGLIICTIIFNICIGSICFAQNKYGQFILSGKIIGRNTGQLVLTYDLRDDKEVNDTVMLNKGHFMFSGEIHQPTQAYLQGQQLVPFPNFNMYDPNFLLFYLEPQKMTVTLKEHDYAHAHITGSVTEQQNQVLQRQLAPVLKKYVPLSNEFEVLSVAYSNGHEKNKITEKRMEELLKRIKPLSDKLTRISCDFLLRHPDSYVSADILDNWINPKKVGGDSAMMYYEFTTKKIQNSLQGRSAYKTIITKLMSEKGGRASPGSMAPDFSLKDQHNKTIKLSDYRNSNYVLLDFWASWCPLCMQTIPRLKKLYRQYHNKGLSVIGLSLDMKTDKWLLAIQKNKIDAWPQLYLGSLFAPGNMAKEEYGVMEIPEFILIDKSGKIIGRYNDISVASGGISLTNKLRLIFN